jgi:hypothetical protein
MPFQPVPNVAQLRLEGRVDGQQTINDVYFEISGGGITPLNLLVILANVSNWWQTAVVPLLSNNFSSLRVTAIDLTTVSGPSVEQATATVGGVGAEAAPNNVAACVSLRTASRGRSYRGRNFVPGIPNSVITLNTLDSAFISDLVDAYTQLVGPGTFVPGWQFCVVSRQNAGVIRPSGLPIPITSVSMVGNSVRSMRSREIGHGA